MSSKTNIWPINTLTIWLAGIELLLLGLFLSLFYFKLNFIDFIQWNQPQLKWLFLLSPALSVVYLLNLKWKSNSIIRWHEVDPEDYDSFNDISFGTISYKNSVLKFILTKLAIVFLILAIVGPKSGGEMLETTSEGIELMIALDVSNSMLAEDITPNRLHLAKKAIKNTISELKGDLVGLVLFAGNARTQMPLSNDYAASLSYLENMNTSSVSIQGTSISDAIEECSKGFTMDSNASKVILIFTDGEDHEEEIEKTISIAKEKGIKISCVAIGSDTGAPIPDYSGEGKYKKDQNGTTIITKVNTAILKQISTNGNGFFMRLKSSRPSEVTEILNYISSEQTAETGNFAFIDLTPRYRIPLALSLLLLMASFLIKEKNSPWF